MADNEYTKEEIEKMNKRIRRLNKVTPDKYADKIIKDVEWLDEYRKGDL